MPMWLGSRLSRRFDDFALADVDGDGCAELFALEIMPRGSHRVSEYRWRSFGMDALGCTKEVDGIVGLRSVKSHIEMITSSGKALPLPPIVRYYSGGEVQ